MVQGWGLWALVGWLSRLGCGITGAAEGTESPTESYRVLLGGRRPRTADFRKRLETQSEEVAGVLQPYRILQHGLNTVAPPAPSSAAEGRFPAVLCELNKSRGSQSGALQFSVSPGARDSPRCFVSPLKITSFGFFFHFPILSALSLASRPAPGLRRRWLLGPLLVLLTHYPSHHGLGLLRRLDARKKAGKRLRDD